MPLDDAVFISGLEAQRSILLKTSYKYLRSWADAEDNVQEVLLKAWRKRANFRGDCKLST
jgi:DNA-directed RNA polymerase specialized sigma24 family protein